MTGRAPLWLGLGLVAAGLVILGIGAVSGMPGPTGPGAGNPGGPGPMMGDEPTAGAVPGPGSSGFVPGTAASPRVVGIVATAQLRFVPDAVTVKQGETITFEVTSMGPLTHEFMVGPAADVAADKPNIPEIADLGMMDTRSLTYTFDGPGPLRFRLPRDGSLRGRDDRDDHRRSLMAGAGDAGIGQTGSGRARRARRRHPTG